MENIESLREQKIRKFTKAKALVNRLKTFGAKIIKPFKNDTFLYVLRRIFAAFITATLIIAIVTALINLFPDEFFYDVNTYNVIRGRNGAVIADNWKIKQLFQYGRVDKYGNRAPVILAIIKYIYWVLPIKKSIPYVWDAATQTEVLKSWEGLMYFGRSVKNGKFIVELLKQKVGISMLVSLTAVVITYVIAYPFGIAMARKPGGTADKIGNTILVLNYAIPGLVFFLFMNQILGNKDGIFGFMRLGLIYKKGEPRTLIAPIVCIAFLSIPEVCIWVRRFMVDELSADYVKFARSKGLPENQIMYTHVLRNAIVPLIRNIPATFIASIAGSYFVEIIWHIPGTGQLLINSLQGFDVPAIQGLTVIYAFLGMAAFLIGDIVTVFFDPRIKLKVD